jgi:heme/copper-type cytochrome/quinol oxidase subunit 3
LGTWAVWLTIVTEALLFVSLFFAYFYVGHGREHWPPHPPARETALILLAILALSSVTAELAKYALVRGRARAARLGVVVTLVLGLGFLALQGNELRGRLSEVEPTTDAYGSLFFAITGFHGLHVAVGALMLAWLACLPRLTSDDSPHRPLDNVVLYWHFVDAVWACVVLVLYLLPGGRG